jgi:hypothetical protein
VAGHLVNFHHLGFNSPGGELLRLKSATMQTKTISICSSFENSEKNFLLLRASKAFNPEMINQD